VQQTLLAQHPPPRLALHHEPRERFIEPRAKSRLQGARDGGRWPGCRQLDHHQSQRLGREIERLAHGVSRLLSLHQSKRLACLREFVEGLADFLKRAFQIALHLERRRRSRLLLQVFED
jgi:hypothetical protein